MIANLAAFIGSIVALLLALSARRYAHASAVAAEAAMREARTCEVAARVEAYRARDLAIEAGEPERG